MANLPPLTPDVASQIAKNDPVLSKNTEQGFANTYGPGTNIPDDHGFAVPALGMSALGLYLLYRKYQQDKIDREEKTAAINWQDVRAQLPGFHAPDMLLGGTLGAGAGLLYDYIRGGEKGKRFLPALRRILTGAAVGAGATNLIGDRARRYLTNSAVPAGYDAGGMLAQLKPRSWQHFWDAAIKDKPSYDPAAVKKFVDTFKNTEVGHRALAARREINRISMGIDLHDPRKSIWQRNTGEKGAPYYSLNERNPEYLRNLAAIYFPARLAPNSFLSSAELGVNPGAGNRKDLSGAFQDPETALKFINKLDLDGQLNVDMFGANPLLGAQQLITRQSGKQVNGMPVIEGMSLDRHDVTPSDASLTDLRKAILSGKVFDPAWRNAPASGTYERGQTNAQAMGGTIGRTIWDRVVRHENPWVTQKFQFTPVPSPTGEDGYEYGLNMLRQNNTPAFQQPFDRGNMIDYLKQLQSSDSIPDLK